MREYLIPIFDNYDQNKPPLGALFVERGRLRFRLSDYMEKEEIQKIFGQSAIIERQSDFSGKIIEGEIVSYSYNT